MTDPLLTESEATFKRIIELMNSHQRTESVYELAWNMWKKLEQARKA